MTKTILIADADEQCREHLKKILAHRYALIVAESPGDGFKIICAKNKPTLVLMGIEDSLNDANENIFELIRTEQPTLTVIALGRRDEEPAAIEAVRMGATGYMIKPLNALEIIALADKHCT